MKHNLHICRGFLLLSLMAIIILLLGPAAGMAAEAGPLTIDSSHRYEGMERSYAEGYLPTVSGGKAVVVLPLLSESATGPLTVSVNLGDPALSPFLYRNYENIFTKKKCTAGGKTISCYPVKFSLKLAKARINGCYPVTFKTSGLTDDGEAFAQEFFVYVSINDGIDPHASEPAQVPEAPSPTPSQPKLMVTAYHLDKGALAAGEKGQLSITVRNTSGSQPVKNIKLSFSEDSGEIWPESTGAIYCAQIGAGSSYTWKFSVNALTTAQSRPHPAVITMEYEDNAGQPCSASDRIILQVRQPVRLEYEEPALPPRVTQGDTVPFTMTLMNLGKSTIFNALLKYEIPGLSSGGATLVGTIPPGESQAGTANFRVESDVLGDVSGTLTLSYEDDYGERYEKEITLATTIAEKMETPPPPDSNKKGDSSFPRWIFWPAGMFLLVGAAFFLLRWIRQKEAMEEDEKRL
jgi:hypothetical protein